MSVIEKTFRFIFIIILIFQSIQANCQDKIHKNGGEIILAFNLEIGMDEVKYQLDTDPAGTFYIIEKSNIAKIRFHDGRTELFVSTLKEPALYTGQARNALKMNFLSPFFGYTQLGFERSLKPGRSIEFTLGLIGLGMPQDLKQKCMACKIVDTSGFKREARGITIGIGYKIIKIPDFLKKDIQIPHLLQGSYLKPAFYGGLYNENIIKRKSQDEFTEVRTVAYAVMLLELGKQWVFKKKIILDIYFGMGFCIDNIQHEDYTYSNYSTEVQAYHFNVLRTSKSPGFALNSGLKIGLLL